MKKLALILSIIMLLSLAACSSGSEPPKSSADASTVSPSLSPAPEPEISHTAVSIHPGEILTLSASGVESVRWTSSDPFVAKVDENGVVTGRHKNGETQITAEAEKSSRKIVLFVLKLKRKAKSDNITELWL